MSGAPHNGYAAVAVGASAGGFDALREILPLLPATTPFPVVVVQHLPEHGSSSLPGILAAVTSLPVKEAEEKEPLVAGTVYVAPPGYHLLVESDRTFGLSVDPPVHYSRPSIDVLFETAAAVYRSGLVGVVLSGANADGRDGLARIDAEGGFTVVQDPQTAQSPQMPAAALRAAAVDRVLAPGDIGKLLATLAGGNGAAG